MAETIVAKRQLGSGRWDRALMKKMVELSVADNYEEAKEEWIATGNVWWGGEDNMPDWVRNSQMGRGKCLCGHSVVYHFEIVNTENGIVECVGSDHINTYLIMKEISQRTGIDIADITQGDIDKWIQERTKTMMAKAWMHQNGEQFDAIYERVKDIDILINAKGTNLYWHGVSQEYKYSSKLRKKAEGAPTSNYYRMASIVWRWEHPDNSRAQSQTRGYPTDKLWQDMIIFDAMCNAKHRSEYNNKMNYALKQTTEELARREARRVRDEERRRRILEDQRIREEERLEKERIYNLPENVEARRLEAERIEKERAAKIAERMVREAKAKEIKLANATDYLDGAYGLGEEFEQMCNYYGIRVFDSKLGSNAWEMSFLKSVKQQMVVKKPLSDTQINKLKEILNKMATPAQLNYLQDLFYAPEDNKEWRKNLTRKQASEEIEKIKGE
tara:strand:- start:745 stop:2076 length:1332 start_codon:yes stop_codon:yes gene_type:complete